MANCEMCGRSAPLAKVSIEGAVLDVCAGCARHGKIVSMPRRESQRQERPAQNRPAPTARKETTYVIVDDYAQKIKKAREKLGLTQEEFSKKLNQRESLMQKIESGQMKPSLNTAQELQAVLKIKLIEEYDDKAPVEAARDKREGFTLGDFIKKKKQ
jgi:putative transcription factor